MDSLEILKDSKDLQSKENIYEGLDNLVPLVTLHDSQFNSFISELCRDRECLLSVIEKNGFEMLWNVCCFDDDEHNNNIWNLKEGTFEIYNEGNIIISFEKFNIIGEDDTMNDGYANFAYKSKEGNILITQETNGSDIFNVSVSENSSPRFMKALDIASKRALEYKGISLELIEDLVSKEKTK